MRADLLPRMPFVIAIVVSAVALVVAIEHRPGTDEAVVSVEELPSGPPTYSDDAAFFEEEAELEIVEYGFSTITDAGGEQWILAAVIVRNPHDGELLPGGLSVQAETERGYPVNIDTMYLGSLPPRSTAGVGYVLPFDRRAHAPEDLLLEQIDPAMLYPEGAWEVEGDSATIPLDPLPQFEFTEAEPLVSPDGYRVHFRAETADVTDVQVSVLFRDAEGRLLGGLPANSDFDIDTGAYRTLPAGESTQYVDVLADWIPEGADLDRIEIGPSRY
jgi:hypothetical protein